MKVIFKPIMWSSVNMYRIGHIFVYFSSIGTVLLKAEMTMILVEPNMFLKYCLRNYKLTGILLSVIPV